MINQEFIKVALADMEEALKMFGFYSFLDKGPDEVMDIDKLTKSLRELSAEDVAETLCAINSQASESDVTKALAETLLDSMQDWDELFDQPEIQYINW